MLLLDPSRETVVLTRQFRLPTYVNGDAPMLVEVCARLVEPGDDPAETARKEAEQETGYQVRDLRKVFALYMSPGASAETLHLYVATYDPGERSGRGGGLREEGEEIEVLELPLARAWAMVEEGAIVDAKTVLLLQHVRLHGSAGRRPSRWQSWKITNDIPIANVVLRFRRCAPCRDGAVDACAPALTAAGLGRPPALSTANARILMQPSRGECAAVAPRTWCASPAVSFATTKASVADLTPPR